MSPRARVIAIAAVFAALAAGGTVALAVITSSPKGGGDKGPQPLKGAPPLVLDLGVRNDPEARSLRQAERLYRRKQRAAAGRIFGRYDSAEAEVGAALSAWPDKSLSRLDELARARPRNALVLLHLGFARLWAGNATTAAEAWRDAARSAPDSPSAQRADDALHPRFPSGQPFFVPSFPAPTGLASSPTRLLAQLAARARRRDVHAKLLYGLALQRLGHRLSARREYDAAARLAPGDPEAQVAAAVVRFDKSRPAVAFSRLGPLTQRFPKAPTVRFHLGVLLLWLARVQPGSVQEGKRQLRLALAQASNSSLGREAKRLLAGLESV